MVEKEIINIAFRESVTSDSKDRMFYIGKFLGIIDLAEAAGIIEMSEYDFLLQAHDFALYGRTFGY